MKKFLCGEVREITLCHVKYMKEDHLQERRITWITVQVATAVTLTVMMTD